MKKKLLLALLVVGRFAAAQSSETTVLNCFQPQPTPAGRATLPVKTALPTLANRLAPDPGPEPETAGCSGVLNVNIHYILRLDGTGNFNEMDDGTPYRPYNAAPNDPDIPADTA
ncbi:MAG: hypothetical protein M3Y54_08305 [Bacteroidota bacterium]|nr:hypothetical protein [Bacteroidota bacterium]